MIVRFVLQKISQISESETLLSQDHLILLKLKLANDYGLKVYTTYDTEQNSLDVSLTHCSNLKLFQLVSGLCIVQTESSRYPESATPPSMLIEAVSSLGYYSTKVQNDKISMILCPRK
jgi:hypothetical protein